VANLPLREAIDLLLRDQHERWQRGQRIGAEAYLDLVPVLSSEDSQAFDLIFGEFLARQHCGEKPRLDEYIHRFPQHGDKLQIEVARYRAGEPVSAFQPEFRTPFPALRQRMALLALAALLFLGTLCLRHLAR
jgi:hypothetical protein